MNVAGHVARWARRSPTDLAIVFEGRRISYQELDAAAAAVARALLREGIRRGDRVALFLPNIPEFAICYLGILRAGAIAVSVGSANRSQEVAYILADSGSRLAFTVSELEAHLPEGFPAVLCEGRSDRGSSLGRWAPSGSAGPPIVDMEPDEAAALLYTSGTTGFPKGATLTHANVISNAWATVHHCGYRRDDRLLLAMPLFHCFGQNFILNACLTAGATAVLHRRFVLDETLDSIRRHRVTMIFGVPTIYITLLQEGPRGADLGSLRFEFSAAATMPVAVAEGWRERFGRWIYEGYGLTECSPFACFNHDFEYRPGTVGSPVENFELRVIDATGGPLAEGAWGEVLIRGPGVMKGYWGRPEDTARALRGGWLHSGDVGAIDGDGYLSLKDRVKDMVNVSGFKVWPAEVEQVLYRHPAVLEAAVFGIPDPLKGESVRAAVVLRAGILATEGELAAYCRERLAAYKVPAGFQFVGELPKSSTGKVLKRVLREPADGA